MFLAGSSGVPAVTGRPPDSVPIRVHCEADDCSALLEVSVPLSILQRGGERGCLLVRCGSCQRTLQVQLPREWYEDPTPQQQAVATSGVHPDTRTVQDTSYGSMPPSATMAQHQQPAAPLPFAAAQFQPLQQQHPSFNDMIGPPSLVSMSHAAAALPYAAAYAPAGGLYSSLVPSGPGQYSSMYSQQQMRGGAGGSRMGTSGMGGGRDLLQRAAEVFGAGAGMPEALAPAAESLTGGATPLPPVMQEGAKTGEKQPRDTDAQPDDDISARDDKRMRLAPAGPTDDQEHETATVKPSAMVSPDEQSSGLTAATASPAESMPATLADRAPSSSNAINVQGASAAAAAASEPAVDAQGTASPANANANVTSDDRSVVQQPTAEGPYQPEARLASTTKAGSDRISAAAGAELPAAQLPQYFQQPYQHLNTEQLQQPWEQLPAQQQQVPAQQPPPQPVVTPRPYAAPAVITTTQTPMFMPASAAPNGGMRQQSPIQRMGSGHQVTTDLGPRHFSTGPVTTFGPAYENTAPRRVFTQQDRQYSGELQQPSSQLLPVHLQQPLPQQPELPYAPAAGAQSVQPPLGSGGQQGPGLPMPIDDLQSAGAAGGTPDWQQEQAHVPTVLTTSAVNCSDAIKGSATEGCGVGGRGGAAGDLHQDSAGGGAGGIGSTAHEPACAAQMAAWQDEDQ